MARKRNNKAKTKTNPEQDSQTSPQTPVKDSKDKTTNDNNNKQSQNQNTQKFEKKNPDYKPMTEEDLMQGMTVGSLLRPICDNMTLTLGLLIVVIFIFLLGTLFLTERDYARNGHWSEEST